MNCNQASQLDEVVDWAVTQSELRTAAKLRELRAKLQEERAKLLAQFSLAGESPSGTI